MQGSSGTIVHICATAPFVEGMGYDENIMPKMHKRLGYNVYLISKEILSQSRERQEYVSKDGVKIINFRYCSDSKWMFLFPTDFLKELESIKPDIIYVHNAQFYGFGSIIKYAKKNSTKIYVDNHDDYYNSPITGVRRFVFRKIYIRILLRRADKYIAKYYGVTPWRCEYLKEVFGVAEEKTELMVMGGDPTVISFDKRDIIRKKIRKDYGINDHDFLIVTGGKIDITKNIHLLAEAVAESVYKEIKLLIFGNIAENIKEKLESLIDGERIIFAGWIDSGKVYDYFFAADLAVFPGTHSILWEQACAGGIPIVVKKWYGMQHVDVGGNAFFLEEDTKAEIEKVISELVTDKEKYQKALEVSKNKAVDYFSYDRISKIAIGLETV